MGKGDNDDRSEQAAVWNAFKTNNRPARTNRNQMVQDAMVEENMVRSYAEGLEGAAVVRTL